MLLVMKKNHQKEELHNVCQRLETLGVKCHVVNGQKQTTISLIGNTAEIDEKYVATLRGVDNVMRISKPFKLASFESKGATSNFNVSGINIGGSTFQAMAGPCSIESEDQTMRIAREVKKSGATFLRGGAFKPRSSPYSFQGMGEAGLKIMDQARKETGLKLVTEAMDVHNLELLMKYDVDLIQIGARNIQNYSFLKELGKINTPILLKRGFASTVDEWLMSAEYILNGGNDQVILCERGIRTFDSKYSRNTLDLNVVPILRNLTHLPIIVDPSHGTGYRHLVAPMALASMASGADGVIVEVHDRPEEALSDGPQALLPTDFENLMKQFQHLAPALGRELCPEKDKKQAA